MNLMRMNYQIGCHLILNSLILHLHLRTLHFNKLISFHYHFMFFIVFAFYLLFMFKPFLFPKMNVESLLFIRSVMGLENQSFRSCEMFRVNCLGFRKHCSLAE